MWPLRPPARSLGSFEVASSVFFSGPLHGCRAGLSASRTKPSGPSSSPRTAHSFPSSDLCSHCPPGRAPGGWSPGLPVFRTFDVKTPHATRVSLPLRGWKGAVEGHAQVSPLQPWAGQGWAWPLLTPATSSTGQWSSSCPRGESQMG